MTIDLMETALNDPLEFTQADRKSFQFSLDLPTGETKYGKIFIDKETISEHGITGSDDTESRKDVDSPMSFLASMMLSDDEEISYGYLHYKIAESYTGFNTGGQARRILSTVIACTRIWVDQNPDVKYIMYNATSDSGAQNRERVYQVLTKAFAEQLGYKVVVNGGAERPELAGTYLLQVKK
jgi:hypothetical protein